MEGADHGCPAAASYHSAATGLPIDRFQVIPNGVDVDRFEQAEPDAELADPTRPTLLFVGRLERRKGLAVLLRAFVPLHRERPDVRLLVVGEGPEAERCRSLLPPDVGDAVTFLGRLEHERLARAFAAADVYVSPALGGESFGIVLLEALAAGCSVVASDLPGYRSVIEDGEHGRLVPPDDPEELGSALRQLLDDDAQRHRLRTAGRRHAKRYDWRVIAAEVRACYLDASGDDRPC